MALVAYDNSDSSEYEDEDVATVVTLNSKSEVPLKSVSKPTEQIPDAPQAESGQNLFNLLPQPSTKKPITIEEDDEFLHKKESANVVKPKAKIMVPSLDDFKDVDHVTPTVKPKAPNGKKSGLLSILPQPRNAAFTTKATTKTLIPHVLTKKPDATVKKKDPLPSPMKKAKTESKLLAEYSDDSDNDDDVQTDFFSINKPAELPPVEDIPLDIDDKPKAEVKNVHITTTNQRQAPNIQSYFKQNIDDGEMNGDMYEYGHEASSSSYSSQKVAESQPNGEIVLDDEAIMKLCGARGKRKREEIQIVDVNQQEVLADAKEWLLKGLMDDTSKRVSASKKRGNEPTNQQKRKHQITYLAHQAKANEVELQNQWANNRMSKRQTQSKYGF
ncbi:proline-rich protein PRCC [Plodia interpunctella]|uniref:proline-rich protein PRCC n=1 Tax=Plodia interpunctella TaxID=58824 RepID=UPI0023677617|nr:proline-rich protein PRCC [Plodia interpunctella]